MLGGVNIKTSCNRDCPDACGIVATVEDGRITKIKGDPDHPVTRGFLCYRTNRFLERQYDPERLTTPLMRKGSDFEPVGWETALEAIAETMLRIREESGAAAIMSYRCGGSLGLMKHVNEYFFERFGPVTVKSGKRRRRSTSARLIAMICSIYSTAARSCCGARIPSSAAPI